MLSLVDLIKVTWDGRISDHSNAEAAKNIQVYHELLGKEYLTKGNLKQLVDDSNMFFKVYSERFMKIESIEKFIEVLGLKEQIVADFGSIEKFVLSHF